MIITDTGFLSSFLKINMLPLIFKVCDTKEIVITPAVLHELEQAPIHQLFLAALQSKENKIKIVYIRDTLSENLGKGEKESIALAEKTKALLLIDDRKALQFAKQREITVMSIPTFLIHGKSKKCIDDSQMKKIIIDLEKKDYYTFNEEIKQYLF
ncbi:hypothetical protein J4410_05345 [Candidatus Woesearchaeota archaeon]|nr:hypothetical protein [Candidatus Woesearchaeota archaeon]